MVLGKCFKPGYPILERRLAARHQNRFHLAANQHVELMTPSEVRPVVVPPPHSLRCGRLSLKALRVTAAYLLEPRSTLNSTLFTVVRRIRLSADIPAEP